MTAIDASPLPIVLLPVRLETRYQNEDTQLAIRVVPDTVHVDAHDPRLTPAEAAAAAAYASAAPDGRLAAWRSLAAQFGPARAAYLTTNSTAAGSRTQQWARAPQTTALPDFWVARGYAGGTEIFTEPGNAIPPRLALGPSLGAAPATTAVPIDDDMRWLVDFDRAVTVGMALVVDLPAKGQRVDQLIVVGIKASLAPTDAAIELHDLLAAHHYTHGLGFVREGTPTNNTPDAPAGYVTRDDDFSKRFAVETSDNRGDQAAGGAGWAAAEALGVDAGVFTHIANADAGANADPARAAMNSVVWPSTWGYLFGHLLGGRSFPTTLDAARAHFVSWVRASGDAVLRIGDQPYGVLPAVSLDDWAQHPEDADVAGLIPYLRSRGTTLRAFWRESLPNVPIAGSGGDLVKALALEPRTVSYRARNLLGPDYTGALFRYFGQQLDATWRQAQDARTHVALQRLGLDDWHPRLEAGAWAVNWYPFAGPAVEASPPTLPAADYLAALADPKRSGWRRLRDESYAGIAAVPHPSPLLYLVARSSLLEAYSLAAAHVLGRAPRVDDELVEIDPDRYSVDAQADPPLLPWDLLDAAGDTLDAGELSGSPLDDLRAKLALLSKLPAGLLERLLAETIDLCSYRLDAWMTSFATRRLHHLDNAGAPGRLIGGYGWGENLAPGAASSPTGFVAAPSIAHASAAAMLAAGHLAHAGRGEPQALAVDLRSDRVRLALSLLDGVRQGQPLSALLGYRFERALQDAGAAAAAIPAFRSSFPLEGTAIADGIPAPPAGQSTAVVDGLALAREWEATTRTTEAFGKPPFPPVPVKPAEVAAALDALDDAVDALGDALLGEGVYQLARGNPARAAAALEAMSTGSSLPRELEFASTSASATPLTHRIVVLLQRAAAGAAASPRAAAEPSLNVWAADVLGDATKILARVDWKDAAGKIVSETYALSALQPSLSALDVVYSEQSDAASELERRLLHHAQRNPPPGIPPGTPGTAFLGSVAGNQSFADTLELARALRDLLANARPLAPADLQRPDAAASGGVDAAELTARASAALARLDAARAELAAAAATTDAERIRRALLAAASFGVGAAIPPLATDTGAPAAAALAPQAGAVAAELDRRRAAGRAVAAGPDAVRAATDRLQAIFGGGFRVLAGFVGVPAPFDVAFARSQTLVGDDAYALLTWFQQLARVRAGTARLADVLVYAELLGQGESVRLVVEQLPYPSPTSRDPERWIGLPFQGGRAPVGRVGVVAHLVPRPDGRPLDRAGALAGLVVDEWTENVPSATEAAAVAMDIPTPSSSPPQAILVAVPPSDARWTTDSLANTVAQTFELARIRSVDADALDGLGQYLPATVLPLNLGNQTISTDLQNARGRTQ